MMINIGTTQIAIADAGSCFYLRLPNASSLHVSCLERPKGSPLMDAWSDASGWTLRVGSVWIEGAGAVSLATEANPVA